MREPCVAGLLSLSAGVSDEAQWRRVLRDLADMLGARGLAVISQHRGNCAWVGFGVSPADLRAAPHGLPEKSAPAAPPSLGLQRGAADGLEHVCFSAPAASGGYRHVVLTPGAEQAQAAVHLYTAAHAPALGEDTRLDFIALAPHLAALHALALRVAAMEDKARWTARVGLAGGGAWALLDAQAAIVDLNDGARDILAAQDGLREHGSRIDAMSQRESSRLRSALQQQLEAQPSTPSVLMRVHRPSGHRPYGLFIDRIPGSTNGLLPSAAMLHLRIVDLHADPLVPQALLRQLHDLTAAEAQVVARLAGGDTSEKAAQRLGISPHTLRHHLERIFAKTGVHRQSDLVRLVYAPFVGGDFRAPPS